MDVTGESMGERALDRYAAGGKPTAPVAPRSQRARVALVEPAELTRSN